MALPYPTKVVLPFDIATAQDMNERHANDVALASGTGLDDQAVTADKVDGGIIIDQDLTASSGYIRYSNGYQICWITSSVTAGGTVHASPIYYSDHSMGSWKKSFNNLFFTTSSATANLFWTTTSNQTTTSGGSIRAYRVNSGTGSTALTIIGYGTWS